MTSADWMLADALGIERRSKAKRTLCRICVCDLALPYSIRVQDYEKHAPQRVRINAELLVEGRVGQDEFRHLVNCEKIVARIRTITQGPHIILVETLADRILDLCFGDRRVMAARVKIEKLDVYSKAERIGVVGLGLAALAPRLAAFRRGAGDAALAGKGEILVPP
jgi:7,8-dihydroneopterin aldolase/epimerase/oxygenase